MELRMMHSKVFEEILARNPMAWCVHDFNILWKDVRSQAGTATPALSKKAEFAKEHMIPVAKNGKLPQKREVEYDKPLHNRVQELFEYDLVIMIGSENDVTKTVTRLPRNVGDLCLFIGEFEFFSKP
ncbi:hypothetical protein ANCCAN_23883 [Ancylostoma caninum]|uniref:Uncharacterized protein n=1 Tax=Ancylostoma caninum TaxID=29170 RepID=A0A368FE47_ANCCA|nr:hypothetical protein ANCCAN_23883 [Ancylostoma caninum]